MRHTVVPLDENIATSAATNSVQMKISMADAIIYTTSLVENAQIITSDTHFNNLPNALVL